MKEYLRENKVILLFILAWLTMNLLQAAFTEIIEDEAYYWLYSRFPAWGYFDHPPIIALLIRTGYWIVPNTLGARLFPSIMGAGTLLILWHLIPAGARDRKMFLWIIPAMILMHLNVAGFAALPDIPLVFFTSLFFLILKRYLEEDRWGQSILLGITVALMMYSKYHALLILFFTILSHLKLLRRRSFWFIVSIAVLLYLPHILWQIRNDFVSFEYHLVRRNDPFQPRQILEYIGNQLLVTGPLVGIPLLYLAFSLKTRGSYERVLKFNLIGFFGFFLLTSIRGHVEPHWTAAAFLPLVTLSMINLVHRPGFQTWIRVLSLTSIPIILFIRLYLVWDFLPLPPNAERMFHQKDTWASQIEEMAGDRPVVFMNKYQYPSVYWFYTGKTAFTRNNLLYRRNQFDIWPIEGDLEGREVILTRWGIQDSTLSIQTVHGEIHYFEIDRYCTFNRLKIKILKKELESVEGRDFSISARLSNPTGRPVDLNCKCDLPPRLMYSFVDGEGKTSFFPVKDPPEIGVLEPGAEVILHLSITAPPEPGTYSLMVSFGSPVLLPGINGAPVNLKVFPRQETGLAGPHP
jgi:hypothetical protein